MNNQYKYITRPALDGEIFYDVNTCQVYRNANKLNISSTADVLSLQHSDPRAPVKVYFDFTYLCNLECRHCITNSSPRIDRKTEISSEKIISIMEDLSDIGVLEIAIGGGEPFCHSDLLPLIEHAKSLNINIILTSNGLLITPYIAQRLREIGVSEVRVSFDGGNTNHEAIRGEGTYSKALQAVTILLNAGVVAVPRITICQKDRNGLNELITDIVTAGAKKVKVSVAFPRGRAIMQENRSLFDFKRNYDVVRYLFDTGTEKGLDVKVAADLAAAIDSKATDGKELRQGKRNSCGAGFETAYISPRGILQPCSGMPVRSFGSVNGSFIKSWTNEAAENWRQFSNTHDSWFLCNEYPS